MSFQKYIANITEKTGKTPEKIRKDARSQGVIVEDMTATVFQRLFKKKNISLDMDMQWQCGDTLF